MIGRFLSKEKNRMLIIIVIFLIFIIWIFLFLRGYVITEDKRIEKLNLSVTRQP